MRHESCSQYGHGYVVVSMYWYMQTMTTAAKLLPDAVWAQLPRTSADRRAVGSVLVALVLLIPLIVAGNATGVLVPRLSYESGSSTVHPQGHTLDLHVVVHNSSSRSWKVVGATVVAPGGPLEIEADPVSIAAHQSRQLDGVIHVDDCAGRNPGVADRSRGRDDINLRVERLLGTTTVTVGAPVDDRVIAMTCGS